jgi:hypothetical protein
MARRGGALFACAVAVAMGRTRYPPPPNKQAFSSLVGEVSIANNTLVEYFFKPDGAYVPDVRVNWRLHTEHCQHSKNGCYCGHVLGSKVRALNRIAPGTVACEAISSPNLMKRKLLRVPCSATFLAKGCPCVTGMGKPCLYSDMAPATTIAMISVARAAGVHHIIEEGREGGLSAFLYSLHGFKVTSVEYLPEEEVKQALTEMAPSITLLHGDGSKLIPQLVGEMTEHQAARTLVIFDGEKRIEAHKTYSKIRSKVALAAFDDSNQPAFRSFLDSKGEVWWETATGAGKAFDNASAPLIEIRNRVVSTLKDPDSFKVQQGSATTFVVGGGWK